MNITLFKPNLIKTLYSEANRILKKHGMNEKFPYDVPDKMKKEGGILALMHMNKQSYFSVCTVDKLYELHNIQVPKERRDFYSSIHCVEWGDMSQDMRECLNAMILKDLEPVLNED